MQHGVSIATKESDLNIVYGSVKTFEERELARASVKYIYTDLNDIQTNYFRLGFHLSEFERMEYYKDFGFASLADFAEMNLSMDKSAVSRCINVFREFCQKEYDHTGCLKQRFRYIDDKYKDYSYSQLCEMLPMSEDARKKVSPEMSVKQIRDIKKEKNVSRENENVSQVATSQQAEIEDKKTKKDFSKVVSLRGSALKNFIKSIKFKDLAGRGYKSLSIYLFDEEGNPLPFEYGQNHWASVIYHDTSEGKNAYYLKVTCTFPKKEAVEK